MIIIKGLGGKLITKGLGDYNPGGAGPREVLCLWPPIRKNQTLKLTSKYKEEPDG